MKPRDAYQMQGYTVVQANPDFLPDDIRWKLTHHDNGEEITRDNPLLEPDGTIDYGHPVWDPARLIRRRTSTEKYSSSQYNF